MRNEADDFILSDMIAQVLNINHFKNYDESKGKTKINTFAGFLK